VRAKHTDVIYYQCLWLHFLRVRVKHLHAALLKSRWRKEVSVARLGALLTRN